MMPFFVFLFCLCVTYATYLMITRKSAEDRERMEKRLREVMLGFDDDYANAAMLGGTVDVNKIRLARDELLSEIPSVNEILKRVQFVKWVKQMIDQSDLHLTVMRLFMFMGVAGLLGMLAVAMLGAHILIALGVGCVTGFVPLWHVMRKRKQRLDKFMADLPDTLELMSRALSSGHAFSEALHMVSKEMPDPISTEFRDRAGNMAERVPLLDLHLCITAIMIQRETGGNLSEILEKVSTTIRERFRILEDLNTLTTSSRMSARVLCGMPVFIALTVSYINPDYMSIMWRTEKGHQLLMAAGLLQGVGMVVIRKIMQIQI
jgi:tight adherence protein B